MDASNIAIVFAPNVLKAPLDADPMVEVSQMKDACSVLAFLIKYSHEILNPNNKYNFKLNSNFDAGIGVSPILDAI
jgi:hypothetical protein